MSIRSLADFNGSVPLGPVMVLARTTTVTAQGAHLVDQVIEVGTFVGHGWGLSHGHGQPAHPAARIAVGCRRPVLATRTGRNGTVHHLRETKSTGSAVTRLCPADNLRMPAGLRVSAARGCLAEDAIAGRLRFGDPLGRRWRGVRADVGCE